MSLISGIFTLPIGFAIQAYRAASEEFPLALGYPDGSEERIRKDDPRYAEVLKTLPGNNIKAAMQKLLDQSGIRKDLIFAVTPSKMSASGTNIFQKGDAVIWIEQEVQDLPNVCSWAVKHEIGHIKTNDNFTMRFVPCICQLVASIFGMCYLSFLPALTLAFTVAIVSRVLFTQWREAKADDFAIENSTDEELQESRIFLVGIKQLNIQRRNTLWQRMIFSAIGNNRLDILHPSITSRIDKIEKALLARHVKIDIETERSIIQRAKLKDPPEDELNWKDFINVFRPILPFFLNLR